jgi:hypothetical protein
MKNKKGWIINIGIIIPCVIWIIIMLCHSQGYKVFPNFIENIDLKYTYTIALILITLLLTEFESNRDYWYIIQKLFINHTLGAVRRITYISFSVFLFHMPITYLIPLFALFSLRFNLRLNKKRGKEFLYISNSNKYDSIFHWIIISCLKLQKKRFNENIHFNMTNEIIMHRAARIKIVFELICVLSLYFFI